MLLVAICLSLLLQSCVGVPHVQSSTKAPSLREKCTLMPSLPLCGFDPALMSGIHGLPGIRARFNPRMFRYASQLVGEVLAREIQRAHLPEIIQATQPLLDGRLVLHNGYIARYRCPQRVVIVAKKPNKLLLQLQNYDVGINANVAGYVNMTIPMVAGVMVPSGLLHIDVHGMVLEVEISVERGSHGPKIGVATCSNFIDKVDVSIAANDSDGDNRHTFLRKFVSKVIRDVLPKAICRMVPEIVHRQIVTRFASIPQVVALTQIGAVTGLELIAAASKPDPVFCTKECGLTLAAQAPKIEAARSIPTNNIRTRHPLCSQCTEEEESTSILKGFTKDLDMKKLSDLLVSVKMLNDYASDNGFAFDLTGEFSPNGQGGTPFGPFPVLFAAPSNEHMLDAIVSDYTINSLLYWAYRKDFISFRVGPDTPKVGGLLKTTCSDEDDEDIQLRAKREEESGDEPGLDELGICLGDLFPAVSEKYPKKRAHLDIRATRAPSILFSARKGGSAHVDVRAEADMLIEGNSTKIGTLGVMVEIDIALHLRGQQAFGSAEISSLKLKDESGTMGVDQESLDNIATLGKGLIEKQVNSALKKGIPIHITQSPSQPATFYNLQIKIVRHGLYVAADLTISQALLGTLTYDGSCYKF